MNFASAHKNWCKKLPLKHRLFEILYSIIVKRLISKLSKEKGLLTFNNAQEVEQWSIHFTKYFETICDDSLRNPFNDNFNQCDAFTNYLGNVFENTNESLRFNHKSDSVRTKKIINFITEGISKFSTRQNLLVLRRIRNDKMQIWLQGNKVRKGLILTEKGFLSTSLSLYSRNDIYNTEEHFVHSKFTFLLIEVPLGTEAIYTSANKKSPSNEYELLIQRGTKMEVKNAIFLLENTIVIIKIIK